MSDDTMDLREQLSRIDRAMAETRKLQEESDKLRVEEMKLRAEELKLRAEEVKLRAEGLKLGRDRFLSPILAVIGIIGGLVTLANLFSHTGH